MANKLVEPNAKAALKQMKQEIANELGLDHMQIGKGNNTSRAYGFYGGPVGGEITKKLVEIGEKELMKQNKDIK